MLNAPIIFIDTEECSTKSVIKAFSKMKELDLIAPKIREMSKDQVINLIKDMESEELGYIKAESGNYKYLIEKRIDEINSKNNMFVCGIGLMMVLVIVLICYMASGK